jgi:hypothetical protein
MSLEGLQFFLERCLPKAVKRFFAPKEVSAALAVLEEVSQSFDSDAFRMVRERIENRILSHPGAFARVVRKGISPRGWVYTSIANRAGDWVASGEWHVLPGQLDPLGPGADLLRLFDTAVDELVKLGDFDSTYASEQKRNTRKEIENAG